MKAWRMAFREGTNGSSLWPRCRELGVAVIEYSPVDGIDLSQHSEGEPSEAWAQLAGPQQASLRRFVYEMHKGDVIYVKEGPKVVGKGIIRSPYQFDKKRRIRGATAFWEHQRTVNWIENLPEIPILLGAELFTVKPLTDEDVSRIERAYATAGQSSTIPRIANDSDIEGLRLEIVATTTKRSRRLRDKAFKLSQGTCAVCQRDFSNLLGGRGIRVLQVHHRRQLSSRKSPSVTKLSELVVVCANCHLLLHLNPSRALTVAQLQRLLRDDGYLNGG